jgi:hypothetical protein
VQLSCSAPDAAWKRSFWHACRIFALKRHQPDRKASGSGVGLMIQVIVNVRDAVFAALVAWTGIGEVEPPKPHKDQMSRGQPASIEKSVQQQAPKVY